LIPCLRLLSSNMSFNNLTTITARILLILMIIKVCAGQTIWEGNTARGNVNVFMKFEWSNFDKSGSAIRPIPTPNGAVPFNYCSLGIEGSSWWHTFVSCNNGDGVKHVYQQYTASRECQGTALNPAESGCMTNSYGSAGSFFFHVARTDS
jgi:hypothetical protein